MKKLLNLILLVLITSANYGFTKETKALGPVMDFEASLHSIELPEGWYLGEAASLEFNSKGHLFVFNRGKHPLLEFDNRGKFVREIGQDLFITPHGLRIDKDDNIWTTDQSTHQVIKFTPDGKFDLVIGRREAPGTGWFERGYNLTLLKEPSDVAFDSDGNIYVADAGNFRVAKFNSFGEPISSWGTKGEQVGEFNFPHSLVVGKNNRLFVTDRENGRVQVFDLDGQFIEQWKNIGNPYILTISDDDLIWLTDARAGRVVKLSQKGDLLGQFGSWGKQVGKFGFGHGIAVGDEGVIYISEILNLRIQKLTPTQID